MIEDANLSAVYTKPVLVTLTLMLHAFKNSTKFNFKFNYQSIFGKLNYLSQTTQTNIMYAMYQVAKHSSCQKQEHGEAILSLVRYLMQMQDIGLKLKPDRSMRLRTIEIKTPQQIEIRT